ncbi:FAD-dependent oxidoreductase [Corynebacterium ulceribovis]|uniref:FAD-dependent oxidoreductase n=1 Tax=Corynebacterium ulceribovis TaxID=487732 RepID=UPI00037937A2|nr:FAD-dependent oxidoreductase [Corynebacterium ulceribovis]
MRIGIVGSGIVGLTAAAGLLRDGHEVTVFERSDTLTTTGASLSLFGNAFDAFEFLGIRDEVADVCSDQAAKMPAGQRNPAGKWLMKIRPGTVPSIRTVYRVALHERLVELVGADKFRLGAQAEVDPSGAPRITVGSETHEFDLVIAADGIGSRARSALGLDPGLRYAGYTAWRGITDTPVDFGGQSGETWGRGKIIGIFPLRNGQVYWYGTENTPAGGYNHDEKQYVLGAFAGWHDPIRHCIENTSNVLRHDVYDIANPLRRFHKHRTVLMGDAAHAMMPNLGQGACQGIEDAATLVALIRGTTAGDPEGSDSSGLDAALNRYSKVRFRRVTPLIYLSRYAGNTAQAEGPITSRLRDLVMRLTPGKMVGILSSPYHRWASPK